ncbi:response regulator transcription factor [Pedobacter sp. SYSU D00535]|uniref:response regulator n=1 Tax=Pedobacter sp. SYSU D00535 TaxID=2810308 RepID=UPI001F60AD04|nr:response regulator transcription factor [Pedobacter sp. SYSU D00535]
MSLAVIAPRVVKASPDPNKFWINELKGVMEKIRLILAEDHVIVRNGLKSLLQTQTDIDVVREASNGLDVLSALDGGLIADLILTDLDMPEMDGLELARQVRERYPQLKVIVLSMMDNEKYIFDAFAAGVNGYLLKNVSIEELVFSIRQAATGKEVLAMELGMSMLRRASKHHNNTFFNAGVSLTVKEMEVLTLIADGYTNQEIAEVTFTSRRTVEGHRQSLIDKTGVKNTAQLIRYACKEGLV